MRINQYMDFEIDQKIMHENTIYLNQGTGIQFPSPFRD